MKKSFGKFITDEYGKSYLASVLMIGVICLEKKKRGKKFSIKKIMDETIDKHKLKLTKKGEQLVRLSVIKSLRDVKVKRGRV